MAESNGDYGPLETLALAAAIVERVSNGERTHEIAESIKPKRKRASPYQMAVLRQHFLKDPFPSTETRQMLASKLGMTPRSVQIWFQNQRQHTKASPPMLIRKVYNDPPHVTFAPRTCE